MKRISRHSPGARLALRCGALILAAVCVGCGGSQEARNNAENNPFDRPRVLEMGGDLAGALREYAVLAERAVGTETGRNAVRRLAYLNAVLHNDSAALYWNRTLATLPTSNRERELTQVQITLLERISALTTRLEGGLGDADSLKNAMKHLSAANSAQARQIRDLETQLKKASEELRQLKEIDARLSGRKPAR